MQELSKIEKEKIDKLSQMEMARMYRFTPSGHIYFKTGTPECVYFFKLFNEKGGMTPGISKAIGW